MGAVPGVVTKVPHTVEKKGGSDVEVTMKQGTEKVTVEAEPKQFKSGTNGFYFRNRVQIGKETYHAQIILSKV
jgi:hypothetical protein